MKGYTIVMKGLERFWKVLKGHDAVFKVLEVLKSSWKFFTLLICYLRSWEVLNRSDRLSKVIYGPQKILIDLKRLLKVSKYQGWSLMILKGRESFLKITSLYQSYTCFSFATICFQCFLILRNYCNWWSWIVRKGY